ncbi:uncharacterized protein LOC141631495 [Silene latifolia]|uniref:uncharacterized protein LOC141631495 n=1 Tax=Silene latifolia TaxID=37657 RepID=UPI003D786C03
MEKNESLDSMSARFSSIVNELKNLGRKFQFEDIVRKVLRSLTKKWRPKVTAMKEVRDLTTLSYQDLIGALMAHELILDDDAAEPSRDKSTTLEPSTGENGGSNIGDETVLFVRRGCFNCGETGHMIKDCPTWEKIKDKTKRQKTKNEFKQVMMVSCCGDIDTEDDEWFEDEEVANLYLSNVSLDLISDSDDNVDSSSVYCLLVEFVSDDEQEVSYLELKKQVKKLSKSALIEYFEQTLDKCHKQDLKLKDLKEQVLDIAEENQLLKAKARKQKSKVTTNIAKTSELTNAEKIALESKVIANEVKTSELKLNLNHLQAKVVANEAILRIEKNTKILHSKIVRVLDKRFQDFRDSYTENNPSKDVEIDHSKCLKEIQSLKDLLLHARKVHDKWEGSTKVLNILTEQSDNNMKIGLGHECYDRRDESKCKSTPSERDFRKRNMLTYLNNCVKRLKDFTEGVKFVRTSDIVMVKENNQRYLESGCSRHITGNNNLFLSLEPFDGGTVTFGDNKKGKVISVGKIGISSSHAISDVYLDEEEDMNEPDFRLSRDDPPELDEEDKEIEGTNDECGSPSNDKGKRAETIIDDNITSS